MDIDTKGGRSIDLMSSGWSLMTGFYDVTRADYCTER